MINPYSELPPEAFWKTGVVDSYPTTNNIYRKKYSISAGDAIATAGSCFAQHIARHLRAEGYCVLDMEPAPEDLPRSSHEDFGYSMYSARYGNIYTVQQLLQLAREAFGEFETELPEWRRGDRYFDALRPGIEPEGLATQDDVMMHRAHHLQKVRDLFLTMDIFIFTMGLTEHWFDKHSGHVLPIAPGVIAGSFDKERHEFRCATLPSVIDDFNAFQRFLLDKRGGRRFRCLLTVSPVPLTATYAGRHVLVSSVESKAILRTAAGQLARNQAHIDYFPSFEIVTHPGARSTNYSDNLRSVTGEAVERVMKVFFSQHSMKNPSKRVETRENYEIDMFVKCEEELLERFDNE